MDYDHLDRYAPLLDSFFMVSEKKKIASKSQKTERNSQKRKKRK
ncbi:MAG: hypothetical protein O2904_00715 [bacterium]|nr:hypothetical protein [bacterium]